MIPVKGDGLVIPPVIVVEPRSPEVPLVFDSPHSGSHYPVGFRTLLSHICVRRAEDAFVDELFALAPDYGATLIAATFPRLVLDPNRAPEDLHPRDATGVFDITLNPSNKAEAGKGIVWTRLHGLASLYDSRLTAEEVTGRIDKYWHPYHGALKTALNRVFARFGRVFHINCHSMRAFGNSADEDGESGRPDFVISDGDQVTSGLVFTEFISSYLRDQKFSVSINEPYKGADLVRRYSDPTAGRHSVQIEINRKLYMDEYSVTKTESFEQTRDVITGLIAAVSEYVVSQK